MEINRKEKLVLLSGIALFLLGLVLLIYSYGSRQQKPISKEKADQLLKQLDTAQPRFEIGYATVDMDYYRENQNQSANTDSDLSTFPIYPNEVATRIKTDSPLVQPDYSKMTIGNGFSEFSRMLKKNKVEHRSTGVICLIVKQVGVGRADSVTLSVDRVGMKDVEELYDALNLGGNEYDTLGIRKSYNHVQKQSFSLRTMETGSAILVPLCITNLYWCNNCDIDPAAWQLTSHVAYVPLTLTYQNGLGKQASLSLSKNLTRPIYINK